MPPAHDPVNHPQHYTAVVPNIECIEVVEHFSFTRGNAIKYLWRAGEKGDLVQDLQKAIWYIQREIDNELKRKAKADNSDVGRRLLSTTDSSVIISTPVNS